MRFIYRTNVYGSPALRLVRAWECDCHKPPEPQPRTCCRWCHVDLCTALHVKAMEERVPLHVMPHLERGTSAAGTSSVKSGRRWTRSERLLEVCHPTVPYAVRCELVLTDDDPSFLGSILHRTLARMIVVDRLLIKVRLHKDD